MLNLNQNREHRRSSPSDKSPDEERFVAPETAVWQEIAGDPAAILILSILRLKNEHDIAELEKSIPRELTALFDKMLVILAAEEIIEITETKIRLLKHRDHSFWVEDYQSLASAMPTINTVTTTKALSNLNKKIPGNFCRGIFYPLEAQEEIHAIFREAYKRAEKVIESKTTNTTSKIGYASIVSTGLSLDDILT